MGKGTASRFGIEQAIIIIIIHYHGTNCKLQILGKTYLNFAYVSSPGSRNFPKS